MPTSPTLSASELAERIVRARAARPEVSDQWQAKRELASSLRQLLDCLSATDAPAKDLRASAAEIAEMASRYVEKPIMKDPPGVAEVALAGMETFHDRSPVVGRSNPIAPPLGFLPDPETHSISGLGYFGHAYEGAPGCVHGGFVATAVDELLGMASNFSGQPGMTGRLEVHYRSPTPICTELLFQGRFDRIEGRKIYTSAEVYAGDRLCAEATGLFIAIDHSKFEALSQERNERLGSPRDSRP
jgi:hypothetical protein